MVCGCFSNSGVVTLTIIDGIMDSKKYKGILDSCLIESADLMNLPDFTFQQDNDPKHTSVYTKEYFKDRRMEVMTWPAWSPDMTRLRVSLEFFEEKNKGKKP